MTDASIAFAGLLVFCLVLLAFTFVGYALLIQALGCLSPRVVAKSAPSAWPAVAVVIAARNEAARITTRIENLLASNYPSEKLEILVVSDGSTDATVEMARAFARRNVKVMIQSARIGKAACLNAALAATAAEIIVFTDARQRFAPETICELVKNFTDPQVGAVSGELVIETSASNVGGGVDAYWKLEKWIRAGESRHDSAVGCTGAVYAIRRHLFEPLPPDTILDDVIIPMRIAAAGRRVVFDSSALAYDPMASEPAREQRRKQRTLAGNFQMLFRHPRWLLPGGHRLWWQLIAHKYLRLAAPLFLAACFLANLALLRQPDGWPLWRALFASQCAFYVLAVIGLLVPGVKWRLLSLPAGFVFLNLMTLRGLWYYLRPPSRRGWEAAEPF